MVTLTTRVVPETMVGRTRALAVSGKSRFARVAGLTGSEALRLASSTIRDMFDLNLTGLQPAYALGTAGAGTRISSPEVELSVTNVAFSAGETGGTSAAAETPITPEQEYADFGRFMQVLDTKENRLSAFYYTVVLGGVMLSTLASSMFLMPSFSSGESLSLTAKALWVVVEIFILSGIVSAHKHLIEKTPINPAETEIGQSLIDRYFETGINPEFEKIDPAAAARLKALIAQAKADEFDQAPESE